jgi:DNA ligase-1
MAEVKSFPTLYKLSNTGKISTWVIEAVHPKGEDPYYEMTFGYKDGAKQTQRVTIKEGKNVGRANETTAWEQCVQEAQSKHTKQVERKGYVHILPSLNVNSVTNQRNLLPMLAKSYDDQADKLKFPCFAQPKLDGIRCLAYYAANTDEIVMISRQGKRFKALTHLEEQLLAFLKQNPTLVLDGELYVHGDTFQDIVSAIKRDVPSATSPLIEYHIYDIVDTGSDYVARNYIIETKVKKLGGNIKVVPTWTVGSASEIDTIWQKAVNDSYEGIMLRNKLGMYKCDGRSSDLLKYKKFMDGEFEIVDAYENKGSQADQCTLVCKTATGKTFGVKPEGSAAQRQQIWEDFKKGQLTGKFLTVRFFSWTTSKNPVPRFPIGVSIRDYE